MTDVLTVMTKELKEFLLQRADTRRGGLLSLLLVLGLMGVYMPLMSRSAWLTNPLVPLAWSWLPIFLTISMVTDSFAGERERHTLETLLASRLSDGAILFGKIFAAVAYAWGLSLTSLLLGAVTVNVANRAVGLQFYPLLTFVGGLALVLLVALLMSSIGVLVSLRSPTVRSAYQKMSFVFLAVWVAPVIALQVLPDETKAAWAEALLAMQVSIPAVMAAAMLVLILLDAALITLTRSRFQRSRLILD